MPLNKKQKKQIDVARKKLFTLRQLLSAAKKQPDEPSEITRLEREIRTVELEIEKIQSG